MSLKPNQGVLVVQRVNRTIRCYSGEFVEFGDHKGVDRHGTRIYMLMIKDKKGNINEEWPGNCYEENKDVFLDLEHIRNQIRELDFKISKLSEQIEPRLEELERLEGRFPDRDKREGLGDKYVDDRLA